MVQKMSRSRKYNFNFFLPYFIKQEEMISYNKFNIFESIDLKLLISINITQIN